VYLLVGPSLSDVTKVVTHMKCDTLALQVRDGRRAEKVIIKEYVVL
jgi:hypothetical protein